MNSVSISPRYSIMKWSPWCAGHVVTHQESSSLYTLSSTLSVYLVQNVWSWQPTTWASSAVWPVAEWSSTVASHTPGRTTLIIPSIDNKHVTIYSFQEWSLWGTVYLRYRSESGQLAGSCRSLGWQSKSGYWAAGWYSSCQSWAWQYQFYILYCAKEYRLSDV